MAEENASGGKKSRSFGSRLLGVFVQDVGSPASERDAPDEASAPPEYDTLSVDLSAAPVPRTSNGVDRGDAQAPESPTLATVDFQTLYAKAIADGDPHFDTVSGMFAGTATLDPAARRTSISALLTAIKADPNAIATTAGKRLKVVQLALHQEEQRVKEAQRERGAQLATFEQGQREEIAAFERKIAELRAGLDAKTRLVRSVNDAEATAFDAFRVRAQQEEVALGQLRQFLQPAENPRQKREE